MSPPRCGSGHRGGQSPKGGRHVEWGDSRLAVLAGHRAVTAAERLQNPVITASAARHLATR